MRITTLVENRSSRSDPALRAEWGLSQFVETGSHRLLLDMGASDAFAVNAALLGVDIASVDAAVVSHHHVDHVGGLRRFFELNDHAPVYLGRAPAGEPTALLPGRGETSVGLDHALMAGHAERLRVVLEPSEVLPGVFVIPEIGGRHVRPAANDLLFVKSGGESHHDDFRHEVVVALQEHDSLVVLTGCSHSGVFNMLDAVRAARPDLPIKAVVGGLHLVALPPDSVSACRADDVEAVGRGLLGLGVGVTWTGHCTSDAALDRLRGIMGARVQSLQTGTRLEL